MDHHALPAQPLPIADEEVQRPPLEFSPAYHHLCQWFDEQVLILERRFAAFQTVESLKTKR